MPRPMGRRPGCCERRRSARRRSPSPTPTTSGSCERAGGSARRLTSFQGQTANPHFSPDGKWIAFSGEYAGNLDVYVVAGRRRRAEAADLASRRRHGAGLDARRQVDPLRVGPRDAGRRAARRASGPCPSTAASKSRCRCRAPIRARFRRRHAHRLPHEQLVGRRASQLSRRTEPSDLDRRSQDLRSRLAAVDRLEGHRSGVGRRHGLLHLRSRRRGECLGVSTRRRRSSRR